MVTEPAFLFIPTILRLVFMQKSPVVYLQQCKRYDLETLMNFFDICFKGEGLSSLNGSKVLVKPNLLSSHGDRLACTHPQFLLALTEWFQLAGARVVVGDSPAFGKAAGVLKSLHIDKELAKRGIKIIEFHTAAARKLKCGVEVGVATELLDCDLFVNAPKLKAHSQMYVTLAVKNIFGIVKGMQKSMLHMQYGDGYEMFSRIILDLIEILPKHVSVVDGIDAMHKEGPIRGSLLNVGCIALSTDPVALDTSLLNALELIPANSPLWLEAKRRNYLGSNIGNIHFPLCAPEKFFGASFQAPDSLAPIRFNPFRFLLGSTRRFGLKLIGK